MTALIIQHPKNSERQRHADEQTESGSLMLELRRARIRIAQLEASLTEAMRDNLANFNRAREAERKLENHDESV